MRRVVPALLLAAPLLVSSFLAIHYVTAAAPNDQTLVGRKIADFELHDYLGANYRLNQWSDKKVMVVVFLGVECPVAKLTGPRLAELAAHYADQGVAFVGIDSNAQDSLADIAHYATEHKITFPILKDAGNTVADLFGAERTPDAFVLDANRVVRYRGMIDNQYGVGYARTSATGNYLSDAVDQLLAGKEVSRPATEPAGCFIGRVHRAATDSTVTFTKQIAPIFNQHCVTCHRPGQVAPFALTSYDEAAGWAETIAEVVDAGRMPPWHASPKFGHFSNDARLSDSEKELIYTWVRNGCPQGDAADAPSPPTFVDGWRIPTPELVAKMNEPFEVPDRGVVDYATFELDAEFPEDRWVLAAEVRPGCRAVVHHMVLFFHPPGSEKVDPRETLLNMISGYGPGMPPTIYSPTACRRIPAGSKLMLQAHYTPNGSPQIDQSEIGLVFADPAKVKKEIMVTGALNFMFRIPAGAKDHSVEATYYFEEDTLLFTVTPHMHLRGKAFQFQAIYPDGREEVLLDVPRYDFNWQNSYDLVEPKPMPEGTKMRCVARFDNSADNLANPDPTAEVTWGEQTWQEMAVGTMNISNLEQDLTLGPPRVKSLGDGLYEAEFSYRPTSKVETVYLAGEFNDWKTDGEGMSGPDADGRYTARVQLKPGDYQYKFVLDSKHWRADPGNAVHAGSNQNSVLHVGASN
jgi:peroxiredoxin